MTRARENKQEKEAFKRVDEAFRKRRPSDSDDLLVSRGQLKRLKKLGCICGSLTPGETCMHCELINTLLAGPVGH